MVFDSTSEIVRYDKIIWSGLPYYRHDSQGKIKPYEQMIFIGLRKCTLSHETKFYIGENCEQDSAVFINSQ